MICIMGMFLNSCQQEETEPQQETGTLHVNIGVLISIKEKPGLHKAAPVLDEFNVSIYSADGTAIFTFDNVSDMPEYIELETGDYYAEAYSDNNLPAEFENPYYFGVSDPFTISSNIQEEVQVNCELANTVVSVVYSDNIVDNFSSYSTTVSSSLGSLVFSADETRMGYFQASHLDILAELSYEKPDGTLNSKVLTGSIPEPLKNRHYEIMIDASIDEGMASFQIIMDETEVATVSVDISDSSPAPPPGAVAYGEILITEIMANPSALSDTEGEWFEIYNNSNHSINLQNLLLGRDETNIHTITDDLELAAGAYFVLSRTETATAALSEYVYGSDLTLSNTGAVLSLYNEGSESQPGSLIFALDYGAAGFPSGTGASICLDPGQYNTTEAILGSSWCIANSPYSSGDLGTPGAVNDNCE